MLGKSSLSISAHIYVLMNAVFFHAIDSANSGDEPVFQFHTISSSVVLQLLNELDVRKSVRPDGISVGFLMEVAEPITAPLTKLLTNLWKSHHWKCSNVTPVHKGDHVMIQQNF